MSLVYKNILRAIVDKQRLLAILIDPDKVKLEDIKFLIKPINQSIATHIFIGGSYVEVNLTHQIVQEVKKYTKLPVVLFPGDITQLSNKADALLFLSLISGRNPDYLIGKHVNSIAQLKKMNLEVIPTGYILIEGNKKTAVQLVTKTKPMLTEDVQSIINTALAGQFLGMKLMYLEAGSGAKKPIAPNVISKVKMELNIPLIIGGGIKNKLQLNEAYNAGADLVVIGTAFEENHSLFNVL